MSIASRMPENRSDPIVSPAPDARDVARLERDADQRADRALYGPDLKGTPSRRAPFAGQDAGFRGLPAGRPLPPPVSARLSRALGVDLSDLRVHTGGKASDRAAAMGARAAIAGRDMILGEGVEDLSQPAALETLAHEAAHFAQAAETPYMPGVLRQEQAPATGIGRAPPEVEFSRGSGLGPEDEAITFAFDSADLTPAARAELHALAQSWTGPVEIDLYGYASTEGPGNYNVNLSAHRAAAVQRLLQPLLPKGSVIRLHAHGEIDAFEPADHNRRVGIDVMEKAAATATPPALPGFPRPSPYPSLSLGIGGLSLGPPPFPMTSELFDRPPPGPANVTLPAPPPPVLPQRFRVPLAQPLTLQPRQASNLFQQPTAADPSAGLNYLPLASAAYARGLSLIQLVGPDDLADLYALHRQLYPWIPESADDVDNWLLSKLVGAMTAQAATERAFNAYLSQEYPGILEESDRMGQIDRAMRGEEEPFTIPPITVLELEFDISLGVLRKK